ncbi:Putative SmpA/OmlA family lipoprotein [Candidatus Phycorickettsia trachydisci]|uniref:SmpA/OmlA family lipoprotein n=1 Tax=Candidatus Phycorickettsia trachydisci TaxID=2115978 RepID=A0A2P1P7Y6_9RICK|nr:outer membrane protein assembly factor BamE [Candidatus Phycorickettsia trachydisci]AVP87376.1 Putative SmpA/OmlA family lipoprotein [Candidatus Phycorickettsia trachydisci]
MRTIFFAIFLSLFLQSCATKHIIGQHVDPSDISIIKEKKYNKDQVAELLAAPSFISEKDPNVWYYISRNMKTYPLSKPRVEKQQIVKIAFNTKGNLQNLEVIEDTSESKFVFDSSVTSSQGTQESMFQHWISNFAKFGKKQDRKKR